MSLDYIFLVGRAGAHEFLSNRGGCCARGCQVFGTGQLRGFAEAAVQTERNEFVIHGAYARARRQSRRRVALAAFGRDPKRRHRAFLAYLRRCPVHELLCFARGRRDGCNIALSFDPESGHRLAGRGDAINNLLCPVGLYADDNARRDIRISAGADYGAKMQLKVCVELQSTVGMRKRNGAMNVRGYRLAGRVGNVVERQDRDVVAYADAAVFAPVCPDGLL